MKSPKFSLIKPILPATLLSLSLPANASLEIYGCDGQSAKNYIEMTYSNYNTDPSPRTMMFFRELILDGERFSVTGDHTGTAYGFGEITPNKINMQLKFARTGSGEKVLIGKLTGNRVNGEWQFTMTKTDTDGNTKASPVILKVCSQIE